MVFKSLYSNNFIKLSLISVTPKHLAAIQYNEL